MSFTFPPVVRGYDQFKRELYAMVKNIKLVRYKIYGCRLIIETDCLPLIGFLNSPDLIDPTMVRWIAYIKLFNPEFRHIKGKEIVVSDALSRKKIDDPTSSDEEDILEKVLGFSLSTAREEYTDEWLDLVRYLTTLKKLRESMNEKEFETLRKWSFGFLVSKGILYRRSKSPKPPRRVLLKECERKQVLQSIYDDFGHRGVVGTFTTVSERYYWFGQYKDVQEYCLTCHECQVRSNKRLQEPISSWMPRTIDNVWFVDVVTMTMESAGYKYVILAREGVIGWVEGNRLKTKTAKDWIDFIDREIITRYGCRTIVSDHGELNSNLMKEYCLVKFLPVATYNPRANVVDRGHKPFTDGLAKAALKSGLPWSNSYLFNSALWSDRITVKRTTGYSSIDRAPNDTIFIFTFSTVCK
jgi:hypothetical protein